MICAIIKGCYPYFSILAFCVIVWRIKAGLWNRRETIVLVCFAGHLLLEILQLIVGDGKWEISRRYLLPAAPLLFGWTAYGLRVLYLQYRFRIPAWCLWSAGCLALAILFFDGMAPSLKNYYSGDSSELRRTCNGSGSRSSTDLSFAPAPGGLE